MRAPRVLVAGAVLGQPMGGVRRHNQQLLPRAQALLARDGGALCILAGAQAPALKLPQSIEVIPSSVPAGPPLKRAWHEGRCLRLALAQAEQQGHPFDLVHTGHLPLPRNLPVPICLMLHDLGALERSGLRGRVNRLVIGDAIRRARMVLSVSELVLEQVRRGFQPRACALVGNGADHLPLLPRHPAQAPFLLHVGHLEPRKDIPTLLAALAFDPSLPPLVCVGRAKGDCKQQLTDLARALEIESRVDFVGHRTDAEISELLSQASCVVIPSRLEGFGIPALEALRAGAPLALSSAAAAPHGLEDCLPTFPVGDAEACARAIQAALHTARAENTTGSPQVQMLLENSSWDRAAAALVQAWGRVRDSD